MLPPHSGHGWLRKRQADGGSVVSRNGTSRRTITGWVFSSRTCSRSDSREPSMSWMLRPSLKRTASGVKTPELSTKPPAAPRAPIRPCSSRSGATPSACERHGLQSTRKTSPPRASTMSTARPPPPPVSLTA
jgi:hypothetical protein